MLTRTLLFLFGLMTLASGIAVVTHAGLGTSTISSMAFVLTNAFDLSMGTFVFLTNVFFFCLQTLVDRTHFLTKFLPVSRTKRNTRDYTGLRLCDRLFLS